MRLRNVFIPIFVGMVILITGMIWGSETGRAKVLLDNGITSYQQEKYFEAIDSFRNAIEINPYYGDAYKYLANVYFSLNDYSVSLENALAALKYANNDIEAMMIVANSYRELGNYDKSEDYYKKMMDKFPSEGEVYRNLAELYLKMNKITLALSMLNKADRVNKNDWRNYLSFGNYYIKNGSTEKAEEYYKNAFNLNPTERQVYVTLGDFYRSNGKYKEAIVLLENGEKLFDNFYSGRLILADCFLYNGNYPKAVEKYQWILQSGLNKDKQFAGMIYYKMGLANETIDKDKAVASYRQAIILYPKNEMIQQSLEQFAIQNFKVDAPIRKELAMMHFNQANLAYRQGEDKNYFINLKRASTLYPFLTDARQDLYQYYESKFDYYNAYQELKSLEKIDPGFKVKDKIESYEWKIKNKKISLDKQIVHPYQGQFIVNSDYFNFASVLSDIALYHAQYYEKFKFFMIDSRKKQGINTILESLRENDYTFFTIATTDNALKNLKFTLYDKTGKIIDNLIMPFNAEEINKSIIRYLDWMDKTYPTIWVIGHENSPKHYEITAGSKAGITNKTSFTAFELKDYGIHPVSLLTAEKVDNYKCNVAIVSNFLKGYFDSLEDKYAVKTEYISQKPLTNLKRILGY